jgi:hypothetical protein
VEQDRGSTGMIALIMGKVDCSVAELLAVNPFAPMAPTAARLWGYDRSASARKECRHAFQGNAYRLQSREE